MSANAYPASRDWAGTELCGGSELVLTETPPHSLDPVRYPPPAAFCDDNLAIRQ